MNRKHNGDIHFELTTEGRLFITNFKEHPTDRGTKNFSKIKATILIVLLMTSINLN